jgi:polynucleotide 5'-kinase involved in rRNA processing
MEMAKAHQDPLDSDWAPSSPARIGSWRYLGSKKAEFEATSQLEDDEDDDGSDRAVRLRYAPPWADVSIIGIAGSSGSGKSTLSRAIVQKLNLPWVVILSMVSQKLVLPSTKQC